MDYMDFVQKHVNFQADIMVSCVPDSPWMIGQQNAGNHLWIQHQNSAKYAENAVVTIYNFQHYHHIQVPGWTLGWTWAKKEVIWSMQGAQTTEQGDCSRFKANVPHCCKKDPAVVDLLPGTPYNQQFSNCCRGGVISSWVQDPANAASSFQLTVGAAGTSNRTVRMPKNYTLKVPGPGYTCGPAKMVRPSKFMTADKRRVTQALSAKGSFQKEFRTLLSEAVSNRSFLHCPEAENEILPDRNLSVNNSLVKYQLAINARTPVEEIQIDGLTLRTMRYNFTPITAISQVRVSDPKIDVLFAILEVGPLKVINDSYVVDVRVVDQGDYEARAMAALPGSFPVAIGLRLKTSTYYGLTLATRNTSSFIFNPPIPEATALQSWCVVNANKIRELPTTPTQLLLPNPNEESEAKKQRLPTFRCSYRR